MSMQNLLSSFKNLSTSSEKEQEGWYYGQKEPHPNISVSHVLLFLLYLS